MSSSSSASAYALAVSKLLQPDETAHDMLRRCGFGAFKSRFPSTGLPVLDAKLETIPSSCGDISHVFEIEGDVGTGKTFMLMCLAAKIAEIGGTVLYFDLDIRLSPERLARILPNPSLQERILVMRPETPIQVLASIHLLDTFQEGCIRLVVIDSLLALHQMCSVTDPLGAGYPVSIPRMLFETANRLGAIVAASKPSVPFEIVSKTWSQGVGVKIRLSSRGKASTQTMIGSEPLYLGEFDFSISA